MEQLPKQSMIKLPFLYSDNQGSSLSRRVLGSLGFILLLMLAVIGIGIFAFIYANEQHTWQGRQSEAARYASEVVASFIERTKNVLIMVSLLESDELRTEPRIMDDLLGQNPALLELIRLDSAGHVLASSYRDAPLLANLFTIPQSRWFLESQAGRFYLGNIQISEASEPYLILAHPTTDGGAVAVRLQMTFLWNVVAGLRFGETGQAYVIDPGGRIIAHTDPAIPLANTSIRAQVELEPILQAADSGSSGAYINFNEVKVVGITSPVAGTDWLIVTELPQKEAFAVSRTALFILGGGLIITGFLVTILGRRLLQELILQPMETLQTGAEQIGAGDLSYRIEIQQQNEVGQVANAFNTMARHLDQRNQQLATQTEALTKEVVERKRAEAALRLLNEQLEQRVAARTTELTRLNDELTEENKERRRVEAALRQSQAKFRALVEQIPAVTYTARLDDTGSTIYVSPQIETLLGFSTEEWLANPDLWHQQLHPDDRERVTVEIIESQRTGEPFWSEYRLLTRDGRLVWVQDEAMIIYDQQNNQPLFLQGVLFDISAHKHAEHQIKASLQEKEVLLKEIHHRVKNNLQVISSLLRLQSGYINDPADLEIFTDSQNRVKSMALIHEKLYASENLSRVDFGEYTQELTKNLCHAQNTQARGLNLNIQVDEIFLDIDRAVPCGLIMNELVSNALKHAFPNGQSGDIWVELRINSNHHCTLRVADNGIGIPPELDIQDTDSLGLQLVDTLVDQLDGTIKLDRRGGTEFRIEFAAPTGLS